MNFKLTTKTAISIMIDQC